MSAEPIKADMEDDIIRRAQADAERGRMHIRVMWGTLGRDGRWWPNPYLSMSAEEQYRQNVANGFHIARTAT